jgi:hypothetical protein
LDVLAGSETEIGFVGGELEGVGAGVGGEGFAVEEFDGDPAVLLQDDFSRVVGRLSLLLRSCLGLLLYEGGGFVGDCAEDTFCVEDISGIDKETGNWRKTYL